MKGSHSILALIPARGGSKGVTRKNIREVGGKPLIAWTIEAAKASRHIDRLILSSDDQNIIDVAAALGCEVPFVRPAELATDEADAMSVVRHALSALHDRYDYLLLLQPTSPMRIVDDIDGAIELCIARNAPACISVCEPEKSPYWMLELDAGEVVRPLFPPERIAHRRQDVPRVFALNGAVYFGSATQLAAGKTFLMPGAVGYIMPKERSFDIDSELDLQIVDFLLRAREHFSEKTWPGLDPGQSPCRSRDQVTRGG
jgi:N-acylneuraminate cytidylyltransferase